MAGPWYTWVLAKAGWVKVGTWANAREGGVDQISVRPGAEQSSTTSRWPQFLPYSFLLATSRVQPQDNGMAGCSLGCQSYTWSSK